MARTRTTTERPLVQIRRMARLDCADAARVMGECWEWGWLRCHFRDAVARENVLGLVAEVQGDQDPAGVLVFEVTDFRAVALQFGVRPRHRRKGVGTELLWRMLLRCAVADPVRVASLDVPETDLGLQLFLKANGFEAAAVLRRPVYPAAVVPGCDAYRMERLP